MSVPCLFTSCLLALPALAGVSGDPAAVDVLEQARATFRAMDSVQYSYRLTTSGPAASTTTAMDGLARLLSADENGGPYLFTAGSFTSADGKRDPLEFTVARVGDFYQVSDRAEQVLFLGKGESVGSRMTSFTDPVFIENFIITEPFAVAGSGMDVSLAGTEEVDGELCDVLVIPGRKGLLARWFIARSDHLPRVVEREVINALGGGVIRVEIHSLQTNPELEPADFKLRAPPGWRTVDVNAANAAPFTQPAPRRMPDGLLMYGVRAPEFELADPSGDTVTLAELRGQVVVLDFWATWCPPCRRAMPLVQKVHEAYPSDVVRVFGVSTSERGGDPAALMKDKGFTYGLLLNGESIAPFYGVRSLPTFYVLDKKGRVMHASRGYNPNKEKAIRRAIDAAIAR
jgi:thiol-disulfide isomerase/thioredoxin